MTAAFALSGCQVVLPPDAPIEVWEAERAHGLGGSDVAQAIGISPYGSPFLLWQEKVGITRPVFTDQQRTSMESGHSLEPQIRREFERRHPEFVVTTTPGTLARPATPWQRVNVDGLVWTADGELAGVFEAKSGNDRQHDAWAADEVPVSYVVQVQWAMWVTGAPRAFVLVLIGNRYYLGRTIERDDDLIADVVAMAAEFWGQVTAWEAPPVDGSEATRRALASLASVPGSRIDLPAEWDKVDQERREVAEQIKAAKDRQKVLDNQMRAAAGSYEQAFCQGRKLFTYKAPKPSRKIDLDELRDRYPDAYQSLVYEVPQSRRLYYSRTTTTQDDQGEQ